MTQAFQTPPAAADIQPLPAPPAERDPPDSALVPVRSRADGWTAERQQAFIAHLAEHGSVKSACAHVGLSEQSAYQLRRRADAAAFRAAWGEAVRIDIERIADHVVDRARHGDLRLRWHEGEVVGEERVYSDRLQLWLIQNGIAILDRLDAARAADAGLPAPEALPPPPPAPPPIRVWRGEDDGELRTNAAIPPGWKAIDLDARFAFEDPDFSRYLTHGEEQAWANRPDVVTAEAESEAARAAFFTAQGA